MYVTKNGSNPKYGIFILAYNVASTLIAAYERIPTQIRKGAEVIYCLDDHSGDNTYFAAMGYKLIRKLKKFLVFRNSKNRGYGGNQKRGYQYAISKKLDVVVMLHGDVQYSPEKMPLLLKPFYEDRYKQIGVVMGSRMLGDPLAGGMPYYKFVGNKILTYLENKVLGTSFSEFHSGYRAYSTQAIGKLPLAKLSNLYHFDTQTLILLNHLGYKIVEVPIPTYYGPGSKSGVKVFSYGLSCLKAVCEYQLSQMGLLKSTIYSVAPYRFKPNKYSSHMQIAKMILDLKIRSVLDMGCAGGFLVSALGENWNGDIVGIEKDKIWQKFAATARYRKIYWQDVEKPLPQINSDCTVAADVLEHLKNPRKVVEQVKSKYLIVSLPNANYLPARIVRFLLPTYKFTKGTLDYTHLHEFTDTTAQKLIADASYSVISKVVTPAPIFSGLGMFLAKLMPSQFAFQFVYLAHSNK